MLKVAVFLLAALCCSLTGCLDCYSTRPVEIAVTEKSTGKPAANVPVKIQYGNMFSLNPPDNIKANTDAHGVVILPLANFRSGPSIFAGEDWYEVTTKEVNEGGHPKYRISEQPLYSVQLIPRRLPWFYRSAEPKYHPFTVGR